MMNPALARVEGPNLNLRLVTPKDAEYVYDLRMNSAYNQHLSEVSGTAEDQRRWIEGYKTREAEGREFYYIIEHKDARPCGVVRLYDLDQDSFTWGSWILDAGKPPKAALESAVLSFGIGFHELHRKTAKVDVRVGNLHAQAFYRRLGMTESHENKTDIFFTYPRTQYEADRDGYMAILRKEAGVYE
jgi:RimJ/RimL family protein N-acetyltransferase